MADKPQNGIEKVSFEELVLEKIKPAENQRKRRTRIDEAEILTQEDYFEKLKAKKAEVKPKKVPKIKIENKENEKNPANVGKKRGRKPKLKE